MKTENMINELLEPTQKIIEILRKYGDPYTSIVITQNSADINQVTAGYVKLSPRD